MPTLNVFNSISADGYFTGVNGDLSWAHGADPNDTEWNDFVAGNAQGDGALVFVIVPVVLGQGRTMFEGVKDRASRAHLGTSIQEWQCAGGLRATAMTCSGHATMIRVGRRALDDSDIDIPILTK